MANKDNFELRTLTFIDSLQPQLAQFIAKDNRAYDPSEYDSALMLEIAPAMEAVMVEVSMSRCNTCASSWPSTPRNSRADNALRQGSIMEHRV